ncbi:MAG: hypothetical protein PHC62_00285 [Candidatus Izemoplasmatales bacterium]|nr:hypothetical protein [Candidatus Izemoplasmatales bacterium]
MRQIKVSKSKLKIRDTQTGEFKDVTIGTSGSGTGANINDNVESTESTWSSDKLKKEITQLAKKLQLTEEELRNLIGQSKPFITRVKSTNGTYAEHMNYSTELTVQLFFGSEDVTYLYEDRNFYWKRYTNDEEKDDAWNNIHNYWCKSIYIDINDLEPQTVNDFECQFWVDDEMFSSSFETE